MQFKRELELAKTLAIEAGKVILEIYKTDFDVGYKEDQSPLTLADKAANDVIIPRLEEEFPGYGILSEESKDDGLRLKKDYCWIVDPLDGTKEFIKKNGEFTVNIALSYNGISILGVIYAPVLNELYYAVKDRGAFYEKDSHIEQIHVSERTEGLRALGSQSHRSHAFNELMDAKKEQVESILAVGSSLKGCMIAKGRAEIYYRFGLTSEWDTAAQQIIVEEAGGIFKQMDHSEMRYNRVNTLNEKGFYILNHTSSGLLGGLI
ncbi:3'(2'),5'-bisphosphate nucleotidase CysQ [Tepidibacter aestuarii]|uniref:3'(2'),5'-bisphosphate nucleotidase CysQ n=1 Tax=Tepidibacter aestuarii TaxID=2925782 RepID=UPI0020BECD86|nr:3'(2'),5'-bisphosphate nucleotidase CysQ [Tepidibacter aestuarii]CAH2214603.1 3'(2'),5'-bisphosphate nucleotidase CysQ [Tepidibacter aestuarii]